MFSNLKCATGSEIPAVQEDGKLLISKGAKEKLGSQLKQCVNVLQKSSLQMTNFSAIESSRTTFG